MKKYFKDIAIGTYFWDAAVHDMVTKTCAEGGQISDEQTGLYCISPLEMFEVEDCEMLEDAIAYVEMHRDTIKEDLIEFLEVYLESNYPNSSNTEISAVLDQAIK